MHALKKPEFNLLAKENSFLNRFSPVRNRLGWKPFLPSLLTKQPTTRVNCPVNGHKGGGIHSRRNKTMLRWSQKKPSFILRNCWHDNKLDLFRSRFLHFSKISHFEKVFFYLFKNKGHKIILLKKKDITKYYSQRDYNTQLLIMSVRPQLDTAGG